MKDSRLYRTIMFQRCMKCRKHKHITKFGLENKSRSCIECNTKHRRTGRSTQETFVSYRP